MKVGLCLIQNQRSYISTMLDRITALQVLSPQTFNQVQVRKTARSIGPHTRCHHRSPTTCHIPILLLLLLHHLACHLLVHHSRCQLLKKALKTTQISLRGANILIHMMNEIKMGSFSSHLAPYSSKKDFFTSYSTTRFKLYQSGGLTELAQD